MRLLAVEMEQGAGSKLARSKAASSKQQAASSKQQETRSKEQVARSKLSVNLSADEEQ